MLTPSSFIPRSLDLHIRQVDDCVADDKEVMLEGGRWICRQRRWRSMLGWTCRLALLAKKL